ncbi:hypothetical protein Tco_0703866 [Tanacetum coccineum]|uniref:Uncharacterized protein n=1 Tax=Tanacetum coccineum TaxID=301880 RepID=A0ABQ4Y012_9ASTR
MELKTSSSFKTTGLLQPWQMLCMIFSKCLTTRVTGWDQPSLQIMQMMYCFVNNIHVDYAELLWEGLYYSLHHPTSQIPYPRFTKIIISHYMTCFPDISRRARDMYHNLQDDDIMKNIFDSGRYKDKVGMQIPDWMKHTEHYRMYAEVFRLDVPLTQSQLTDSTQGTHRTPCAPRRSARLTLPVPVPTVEKADKMILQDTLQVSLVEHKSRKEQEARENMELVDKHLASEKIEKLVEGSENVIDDSSPPRNDKPQISGTRLEPWSDKESPEAERTNDEEVEVTNVIIPVNVNGEEDEITDEVYELKRREKGKVLEDSRSTPLPTPIRSPKTHTHLVSSDTEKLQELMETHTQTTSSSRSQHTKLSRANRLLSLFKAKPARFKRYKNFFQELQGRYTYLFEHLKQRFLSRKSFDTLADHLQEVMVESLPIMKSIDNQIHSQVDASVRSYMSGHILHVHPVQSQTQSVPEQQYQLYLSMKNDPQLQQQDIAIWLALQMKFENLQVQQTTCRPFAVRPRYQDDPHDDAHPEGENSAKRQKTSEYKAYVSGESSSRQVNEEERGPSTLGNQEQEDDYDFWTDSYASDDDEIPSKQVSQDIMEEVSLTIDEAKLKKMADEMLRQRCTSGDEHQYHIDQMKNFLKSDIVWESRKEILVSPHPRKTTPLVQSCQRDPEAPALSLINQDLLYLKKGSSGPEKISIVTAQVPAIIFNDDDIEESNFQRECIVSITEPDYKNLNKNDIEDMYLLIMNGMVPDYAKTGLLWSLLVFIRSLLIWERVHDFQLEIESYQQKVNLTVPTIFFPGVEKHKMLSIVYEPVHGIIYKNSKKEKKVMRHSDIHKFFDATLNRVLEGLKSYNNDVKYGYVQRELTNDEVEYLKLF